MSQQPPPGQPYPQPPYGGYPPPPRKRRKWPWIVGGIVVLFIALIGGCMAMVGGAVDHVNKTMNAETTVTYEVTSDAATANNITYTGDGGGMAQDNGAALPWSKKTTVKGFGLLSLTAQAAQGASTITCRITRDGGGPPIAEQTSTGQYAIVSCSGSISGTAAPRPASSTAATTTAVAAPASSTAEPSAPATPIADLTTTTVVTTTEQPITPWQSATFDPDSGDGYGPNQQLPPLCVRFPQDYGPCGEN